ncbi:chemotaxis response regulator protein-glutamate methylesterase [Fodinicurvata halophila]|uniref:Protein-glutamate methylesterase/protein-glutamine glutaminase n=1 Tax=Fodinicurvata halophila TaxID=1419723 RepID=A0ABV8UK25_9PROT
MTGQTLSSRRYRVMVVDDSAVIRGLLTRTLEEDHDIQVTASVSNGQMALNSLAREPVDVVVLDIEMPVMDGLTALPKILEASPRTKVIMASTLTRKNADVSLQAMRAGAADYIAKPTSSLGHQSAADFRRELRTKVKALAEAGRKEPSAPTPRQPEARREQPAARATAAPTRPSDMNLRPLGGMPPRVLAIGSSTGGPQALFKVLGDLRGVLRDLPVLITQHMPATFTTLLAEHLARVSGLPCKEGENDAPLQPGHIHVAPGGYHMMAVRNGADKPVIRLTEEPPENFCRPSVNPMLRSLSDIYGARTLVLILTGMGSDGLAGAEKVVANGGTVIAQDEASSVVWGMPGAVAGRGLCSAVLPLMQIAPYLRDNILRTAA